MNKPKIIIIVGRSNSGKTTLIEKLIQYYKDTGKKVSAIKSMRHDFNIDYSGKDTYRYKESGAFSYAITNNRTYAVVSDIDEVLSPIDIALKYFYNSDIVIIEGYKESDLKKIEVIGDSSEQPLFKEKISNIKIIVSDKKIETDIPLFKRNDISGLVQCIEELILND